ncbi:MULTISPECIES: type VII secretion protein EssC [unclassified Enterococcus]|uniref:type VII secretion protein EssC n=1 Tax=unclassified Enterococcus TaxID=2608891 RepID=UPI001A9AF21E|nr:type VII secretion protein EssC [Enterococcus sp. DIV1271a]MBO1299477.1 type VII secretion protein EssC [Enterococcus sp. DIV1271a]
MKQTKPISMTDQIQHSVSVLYDLFYFGSTFSHKQMTEKMNQVMIENRTISCEDGQLFCEGELVRDEKFLLVQHEQLKTVVVNKPRGSIYLSRAKDSAIWIDSDALVFLDYDSSFEDYQVKIYPSEAKIYYNHQRVKKGVFPFSVGDQLIIDYLIIEMREKQLKITDLKNQLRLDPWQLLEEPYLSEYPANFPAFRRSPRIHLKEPKEKVAIQPPKQKSAEGKNEWLKTIVPPLGMVVLSGATSFLSGGNPVMLISMGGASLLTTGFSVSSYFTNKKETNRKNHAREAHYRQYMIKKKSELNVLQQTQKTALEYMNPSLDELALMAKDYHSRIYERMTVNEDFLSVRLGIGEINASFQTSYQPTEEDELSNEAFEHLNSPYKQLEDAPIIVSLLEQTVGLAGTPNILRTALQLLLFQLCVLHSYRDVEFITLIPSEEYEQHWREWRWLPHDKIRSLNLRGIVHTPQSRDMVLNSFYQIIAKRKQQVREAGNEKVHFQPHYVFSILDESWLAGHGLNEFLAENLGEYGITVIWGKETLNMLPETTTTLIEYQSNEAATLINQNNEYVNQRFIPNHLPTTYPIEKAIRRLANLHHVEVEKNVVPDSLSLLDQYEVKTVEELMISNRWASAEPNKSIRSLIGWRGKKDFVYWDLHERVHGPHALVGGTTGSGKSEFLTTYLIGLAINFSPEDIGMLIIDWKGGGIANTLDHLPHFMGAITNLDGAGTARALASIKAELAKRQREFAKYGVNNINGYMSLYKQRKTPKPDVVYPQKPLPHLILVSDEFAELKANVPEFLDELTSVARIGRSLGVHLILATQKPSGVVNDQIEANSTSKIALKMASIQDSNELLKTPDAAQIVNPGRGYLKVGENEVYELFQSGYAGVPYDPEQLIEEVIDERVFKINELGQLELLYDPDVEVVQGKDTRDLPTQLEAVIDRIKTTFAASAYKLPDKPWLPNLEKQLVTPKVTQAEDRNLAIPFGCLDIPSEQKQLNHTFNLEEASHTLIVASPGYGKSTLLQTLVMNLARQNTPEMIHFHLIDFGNNGLLPLKELPHVADIATLEEDEKLQKMLGRIEKILAERKSLFKQAGVANLTQYETRTTEKLPILGVILDSYDGLSLEDKRKDRIDEVLLQLLRDGASLGVFLVMTANRAGSIRTNMMSNIATKIAMYLNDENEINMVMGRNALTSEAINGRGQVLLSTPTTIQFYLPSNGKNDAELLQHLGEEIIEINRAWTGERPDKIPMAPENLTRKSFTSYLVQADENKLYLGLNKATSLVESFALFQSLRLGIFFSSNKQFRAMMPWLLQQICQERQGEVVLIDANGTLESAKAGVSLYLDRSCLTKEPTVLKTALEALLTNETCKRLVIINGIADLVGKLTLDPEEVTALLSGGSDHLQFFFIDNIAKVGNTFGGITTFVKENIDQILFGGSLQNQLFIENLSYQEKNAIVAKNVLHSLKDDQLEAIVFPTEEEV